MDGYCRKERSIKKIIEKYFIFAELWPFEFEKVEKMTFFSKNHISVKSKSLSIISFHNVPHTLSYPKSGRSKEIDLILIFGEKNSKGHVSTKIKYFSIILYITYSLTSGLSKKCSLEEIRFKLDF